MILVMCFPFLNFGQACGSGINKVKFIDAGYSNIYELDYELLLVNQEVLNQSEFIKSPKFNQYGIPLSESEADKLISTSNDYSEYKGLMESIERSDLSIKGKHHSIFNFHTFELLGIPIILKINHNYEDYYFLGNFFGGCNRQSVFVLDHSKLSIKADVNADGFYDLVNLTGVEQLGQSTFDVYIYDPKLIEYRYSEAYSNPGNDKSSTYLNEMNCNTTLFKCKNINET